MAQHAGLNVVPYKLKKTLSLI